MLAHLHQQDMLATPSPGSPLVEQPYVALAAMSREVDVDLPREEQDLVRLAQEARSKPWYTGRVRHQPARQAHTRLAVPKALQSSATRA